MTDEQKAAKRDALEILKAAAPDMADLLLQFAQDGKVSPALRVRCAETVMDRVYGRAAQPIDSNVQAEITVTITGGMEEWGE